MATTARNDRRGERGSVLLIALLVTMLIGVVAVGMATTASLNVDVSARYHATSEAFYAADGASRAAFDGVVTRTRELGRFPSEAELAALSLPAIDRISYSDLRVRPDGLAQQGMLDSGFYQGLIAMSQAYEVSVTATKIGFPPAAASVSMRAFVDLIPIFQFAVFYEKDLEVSPGPRMIINGRVHTNADLWVDSSTDLFFRSVATVAGNVYNRPEVNSPMGGDVHFRNSMPHDIPMDGLDSTHPDWYAEALDRWDGNLRSGVHGVENVRLSIETQDRPRTIIEPGRGSDTPGERASKLFYAADLRIINGVATDRLGNPVSLIDPVSGTSAIRPTVIFDRREDHEMLTVEVDIEKLGNLPDFPTNGLVYVASASPGDGVPAWDPWPTEWDAYTAPYDGGDTAFAVKLANGRRLIAPLTVVTDNPGYVRGNYNTLDKKPAAFMADTITLLSDNWGRKDSGNHPVSPAQPDDDLGYSQLSHSQRQAHSTTYNLALAFGAIEGSPTLGNNGGLENAMRFLERWTSRTATYNGSLIVLWYPEQAYSDHLCCGYTYSAPRREFSFDTDFLDPSRLPPHTPAIYALRLSNWDRS